MSPSDDRSVTTTISSEHATDRNENTNSEVNPVAVLAIVEVDGLFDDGGGKLSHRTSTATFSDHGDNNSDTFITKLRIYQSELLTVVSSSNDNEELVPSSIDHQHRTRYKYTSRQLKDKLQSHLAGRPMIPSEESRNEVVSSCCYYDIYIYNNGTNEYTSLPDNDAINILRLYGRRWRLRVIYRSDDWVSLSGNKSTAVLAIQGRYFAEEIHPDGTIRVGDHHIQVLSPHLESTMKSDKCTGYHVWDGAILLIRYLEAIGPSIFNNPNQHVLELGSGCGVVGITAALLGAQSVVLTDLPELLPFLQSNVDVNFKTIELAKEQQLGRSLDVDINCESCDWTEPLHISIQSKKYDIILVADCIWIESLVTPLFDTLRKLTDNKMSNHEQKRPSLLIDDFSKAPSNISEIIFDHDPIASYSISHLDLNKSKVSLDESPVNSDANIYHQQSSQHVTLHDNETSSSAIMDQSLAAIHGECESQAFLLSLLEEQMQKEVESDDPEPAPIPVVHRTTVLIAYQRRGKSTHERFMRDLHALFSMVEVVTVPNFDYPQDIFYIYSCRR